MCSDMQWHAVTCSDMQWHAVTCSDMQWHAVSQWSRCSYKTSIPGHTEGSKEAHSKYTSWTVYSNRHHLLNNCIQPCMHACMHAQHSATHACAHTHRAYSEDRFQAQPFSLLVTFSSLWKEIEREEGLIQGHLQLEKQALRLPILHPLNAPWRHLGMILHWQWPLERISEHHG